MNRNGMTRGMDNGQFTYDENIEPEPSYLDDRVTYGVPSLFNNYTVFTHCMCSKKEDFFDNVWEMENHLLTRQVILMAN